MTDPSIDEPGIPDRCPHCGAAIDRARVLAIAEGAGLPGDPLLQDGLEGGAPLRFRPSRFDSDGRPIDPSGASCRRLACPSCRREIATIGEPRP